MQQSHWLSAPDEWAWLCVSSGKVIVSKVFYDDSERTSDWIENYLHHQILCVKLHPFDIFLNHYNMLEIN